MAQSAPSRIDLDTPDDWDTVQILPAGLDSTALPPITTDLRRDLSARTVLALVQWVLTTEPWPTVTARSIRAKHGNQYTAETYSNRLQSLAERDLLDQRQTGTTYQYQLKPDHTPAPAFRSKTPEISVSSEKQSVIGLTRSIEALIPESLSNRYLSIGDAVLTTVCTNLLVLLATDTLGPISKTAPTVIIAWALLSFAISTLIVGTGIAATDRLNTHRS